MKRLFKRASLAMLNTNMNNLRKLIPLSLLLMAAPALPDIVLEPLPAQSTPRSSGTSSSNPFGLERFDPPSRGNNVCRAPTPSTNTDSGTEEPSNAWTLIDKRPATPPPPPEPKPIDPEHTYFPSSKVIKVHTVNGEPIMETYYLRPKGLYFCKRPVGGAIGSIGYTHHYFCVVEESNVDHVEDHNLSKDRVSCYGFTYKDKDMESQYPYISYPGTVGGPLRGDTLEAGECELVKGVLQSCAADKLQKISENPAPNWGIGFGLLDCQEWASEVQDQISAACQTMDGLEGH